MLLIVIIDYLFLKKNHDNYRTADLLPRYYRTYRTFFILVSCCDVSTLPPQDTAHLVGYTDQGTDKHNNIDWL